MPKQTGFAVERFSEENVIRSRARICSSFLGNRRRGGSEVSGMRLEVRKSRTLRSSDLLPLTSGSSQPKDGSMIWDEGRRTALHSVQRFLIKRIFLPAKRNWPRRRQDWPHALRLACASRLASLSPLVSLVNLSILSFLIAFACHRR